MSRFRIIGACLLIVMVMSFSTEGLAGTRANVRVSARVLPWVQMDVQQHAATFLVVEQDIERGYVDIATLATVGIKTNTSMVNLSVSSRDGTRLMASLAGARHYNDQIVVALTAAEKDARYAVQKLDVRVLLDGSTEPGVHQLGLQLGVDAF